MDAVLAGIPAVDPVRVGGLEVEWCTGTAGMPVLMAVQDAVLESDTAPEVD